MMKSYPLRDALDLFLASVPSCPAATARRALVSAAQEFCDMTGVHREPSDKLPSIDGCLLYEFDAPDKDLIILRMVNPSHRGTAVRNILELDSEVRSAFVSATLILGPRAQAKTIWAPLIDQYGEALAAGALKRLLMQQGTDYYNPNQAAQEAAIFADHLHNARIAVEQPRKVKARGRQWAC